MATSVCYVDYGFSFSSLCFLVCSDSVYHPAPIKEFVQYLLSDFFLVGGEEMIGYDH